MLKKDRGEPYALHELAILLLNYTSDLGISNQDTAERVLSIYNEWIARYGEVGSILTLRARAMALLPRYSNDEIMAVYYQAVWVSTDELHQVLYRLALFRAHRLEQYHEAIGDLDHAAKHTSIPERRACIAFTKGYMYIHLQDLPKALQCYEEAWFWQPESKQIQAGLAYVRSVLAKGVSSGAVPPMECRCMRLKN